MNWYAYPIIFDAMKEYKNTYLSIEMYDSTVYIYQKNGHIYIKDLEKEIIHTPETFNFHTNKIIEKITIIQDKTGFLFCDIFDKRYFKAATIIQDAWKKQKVK
jgi:hypothetical protein